MWGVLVSHELEDPEGSVVSVQMLAGLQASFSVPELSACVFFLSWNPPSHLVEDIFLI